MIYTLNLLGFLALLVQVVLPLAVALVTQWTTPSAVKGIVLLGLDALTTLLVQGYDAAQHDVNFDWKLGAFNVVIAFVISVASYFGIWRGTSLRAGLQSIGSKTNPDGSAVRSVA